MLIGMHPGVKRRRIGLRIGCVGGLIWAAAAPGDESNPPSGQPGEGAAKATASPPRWQPAGRMPPPTLAECSGIVASRRYPGIFWVHNDSGHRPAIYAVKESGELVAEVPVEGATNSDWEDIAGDDRGLLYIGDIGNNFGMFPVRSVYQVVEPDPFAAPVRPARIVRRFKYSYPGQRFNAEGLFARSGRLFVLSRQPSGRTGVYRLGALSDKTAPLVEVASLPVAQVSGADVSTDGRRLAVCTPNALLVYHLNAEGVPNPDVQPLVVHYPCGSIEGCCFDGEDVVLASEKGLIYRVSAADLAAGTRFRPPPPLKKRARPR